MELTQHEQKIFDIVSNHPEIMDNPEKRESIAKLYGLTEKTLRNRIAELKKRGLINSLDSLNNGKKLIQDGEVNIGVIFHLLLRGKKTLIIMTTLITLLGFGYAVLATPYYSSTITLYPAGELAQSSTTVHNSLKGLAESMGLSGTATLPTFYIPDIVNSNRLKRDIVTHKWETLAFKERKVDLIEFWEIDKPKIFSLKRIKKKLFPKLGIAVDPRDRHIESAILKLTDQLKVEEDITRLIRVTTLMEEPTLARDIANYISDYVDKFISAEEKRENSRNLQFISGQKNQSKFDLENSEESYVRFKEKYPQTVTPELMMTDIRLRSAIEENRAVYITLRQQFEIAKIEEAKEKLLINILDYAVPATEHTKPRRGMILVLAFIIGIFSASAWILFKNS